MKARIYKNEVKRLQESEKWIISQLKRLQNYNFNLDAASLADQVNKHIGLRVKAVPGCFCGYCCILQTVSNMLTQLQDPIVEPFVKKKVLKTYNLFAPTAVENAMGGVGGADTIGGVGGLNTTFSPQSPPTTGELAATENTATLT